LPLSNSTPNQCCSLCRGEDFRLANSSLDEIGRDISIGLIQEKFTRARRQTKEITLCARLYTREWGILAFNQRIQVVHDRTEIKWRDKILILHVDPTSILFPGLLVPEFYRTTAVVCIAFCNRD